MFTENTHLKNVIPVGNSNTSDEMDIMKGNTYQRPLLIVAGFYLASLVLTAVACKTAGYSLVYTGGFAESAGALANYQVDTTNVGLTKDVLGLGADSENETFQCPCGSKYGCYQGCAGCKS
mmetsp:Transcript_64075/g.71596  ORF Transcript_64075/g.71596 Transcript_64075/m.71596 type:complete len:121 (+) Transcript_64075:57-419(+)